MKILDHYYLELKNNCFAVVVGNKHYDYLFIGYIKYCPSSSVHPWRNRWRYYRRIVYKYDPYIVHSSAYMKQYIPYYGVDVPVIPSATIEEILDPIEKIKYIIEKPGDPLEEETARLVHELYLSTGIHESIGVTGSILAGIHNVEVSDIDLVVYGWRSSIKVIEALSEKQINVEPFSDNRLKEWLRSNGEATGLTPKQVEKYYRIWRRGVYSGREYSILYNDGIPRRLDGAGAWKTIRPVRIEASLRGGLEGLNYPSRTIIEEYHIAEGYTLYDIVEAVSFEALYIPLFYEGGKALITGILQCNDVLESCRILVGGVEYPGKIIWVK